MDYAEWQAQSDIHERLQNYSSADEYFREQDPGTSDNDKVGAPVIGYRFGYLGPDNKVYSPFQYDAKSIGLVGTPFIRSGGVTATPVEGVNNDDQGMGYYYWKDRELAEDYMRNYFKRHIEDKGGVPQHYLYELNEQPVASALQDVIEPTTSNFNRQDVVNSGGLGYNSLEHSFQKTAVTTRDLGSYAYFGDVATERPGSRLKDFKTYGGTRKPLETGKFVLFVVRGEAAPHERNDAGYVMNNMQYGERVLEFDPQEIHQ